MAEDYYKVLSVEPTASTEEIEEAARSLSKVWNRRKKHSIVSPQKHKEIQSQIRKASSILTDSVQRHEYDVRKGFKKDTSSQTRHVIPLKYSESLESLEITKIPGQLDYDRLEKSIVQFELLDLDKKFSKIQLPAKSDTKIDLRRISVDAKRERRVYSEQNDLSLQNASSKNKLLGAVTQKPHSVPSPERLSKKHVSPTDLATFQKQISKEFYVSNEPNEKDEILIAKTALSEENKIAESPLEREAVSMEELKEISDVKTDKGESGETLSPLHEYQTAETQEEKTHVLSKYGVRGRSKEKHFTGNIEKSLSIEKGTKQSKEDYSSSEPNEKEETLSAETTLSEVNKVSESSLLRKYTSMDKLNEFSDGKMMNESEKETDEREENSLPLHEDKPTKSQEEKIHIITKDASGEHSTKEKVTGSSEKTVTPSVQKDEKQSEEDSTSPDSKVNQNNLFSSVKTLYQEYKSDDDFPKFSKSVKSVSSGDKVFPRSSGKEIDQVTPSKTKIKSSLSEHDAENKEHEINTERSFEEPIYFIEEKNGKITVSHEGVILPEAEVELKISSSHQSRSAESAVTQQSSGSIASKKPSSEKQVKRVSVVKMFTPSMGQIELKKTPVHSFEKELLKKQHFIVNRIAEKPKSDEEVAKFSMEQHRSEASNDIMLQKENQIFPKQFDSQRRKSAIQHKDSFELIKNTFSHRSSEPQTLRTFQPKRYFSLPGETEDKCFFGVYEKRVKLLEEPAIVPPQTFSAPIQKMAYLGTDQFSTSKDVFADYPEEDMSASKYDCKDDSKISPEERKDEIKTDTAIERQLEDIERQKVDEMTSQKESEALPKEQRFRRKLSEHVDSIDLILKNHNYSKRKSEPFPSISQLQSKDFRKPSLPLQLELDEDESYIDNNQAVKLSTDVKIISRKTPHKDFSEDVVKNISTITQEEEKYPVTDKLILPKGQTPDLMESIRDSKYSHENEEASFKPPKEEKDTSITPETLLKTDHSASEKHTKNGTKTSLEKEQTLPKYNDSRSSEFEINHLDSFKSMRNKFSRRLSDTQIPDSVPIKSKEHRSISLSFKPKEGQSHSERYNRAMQLLDEVSGTSQIEKVSPEDVTESIKEDFSPVAEKVSGHSTINSTIESKDSYVLEEVRCLISDLSDCVTKLICSKSPHSKDSQISAQRFEEEKERNASSTVRISSDEFAPEPYHKDEATSDMEFTEDESIDTEEYAIQKPESLSKVEKRISVKDWRYSFSKPPTMDLEGDEESRPVQRVSATTRIAGADIMTVYNFGTDAEFIEVFINGERRAKIVKDEKQDLYCNVMKHDDLPPGVDIAASTVIVANDCVITTEVCRRGKRESIAVYKDNALLCRSGNTILDE